MTAQVVVVMGVSGSGKTTVAREVASAMGWPFQEGDALHPRPPTVDKMARGEPLDDADRAPWLDRVAAWIDARRQDGGGGVITCSALKRAYRERIGNGRPGVRIVYLSGDHATLEAHVRGRHHEFMPATLLDSQLATLEPPAAGRARDRGRRRRHRRANRGGGASPPGGLSMRNNRLGRTGLFVSELCLGTMTFGGGDGTGIWSTIGGLDQAGSERLIARAMEAGINVLDTADVYSDGGSETIVGEALRNLAVRRDEVVIATKAFGPTGPGANSRGQLPPAPDRRGEGQPAPAADGSHRPVPAPRVRRGHADRGDAAGARHARPARPRPLRRRVELGRVAGRQGARHLRTARPAAVRQPCRPTTAWPAATWSGRSCRCWPASRSG